MNKPLNPQGKNQAVVLLDTQENKCYIGSEYSRWDTLFLFIEATAFLCKSLIQHGEKTEKEIYDKLQKQLFEAFFDYKSVKEDSSGSST